MTILSRFLDTNGAGTGSVEATGDYSVTPGIFKCTPAGSDLYITRMIVLVQDSGGFRAEGYGDQAAGITNGIGVSMWREGSQHINFTPVTVKSNAEWGGYCYDTEVKAWGGGDDLLLVRWTFEKSGEKMRLRKVLSDELRVTLNDDMTFLVNHRFLVQGHYPDG